MARSVERDHEEEWVRDYRHDGDDTRPPGGLWLLLHGHMSIEFGSAKGPDGGREGGQPRRVRGLGGPPGDVHLTLCRGSTRSRHTRGSALTLKSFLGLDVLALPGKLGLPQGGDAGPPGGRSWSPSGSIRSGHPTSGWPPVPPAEEEAAGAEVRRLPLRAAADGEALRVWACPRREEDNIKEQLNFFTNKKWFFAFFTKLIWQGVGFWNRTGAEIGY